MIIVVNDVNTLFYTFFYELYLLKLLRNVCYVFDKHPEPEKRSSSISVYICAYHGPRV